ncbi:MAG: hypothetical protein A4C66_08455 [Nitrospira sp. HN-bin3]|nr:MAG: hypothetical protein A4C66_08455 [Nitrospira sp. HN-bin3]
MSHNIFRIRSFNLIGTLVLLSTMGTALLGCIGTYNESPLSRTNPLEQQHQRTNTPLHVYYYSDVLRDSLLSSDLRALKHVFGEHVAEQTVVATVPPQRGLYVRVYKTSSPGPPTIFYRLWLLTVFVIPYYRDVAEYSFEYDLYIDTVLRKTYHYEIRSRHLFWIGALPFSWITLLMNSYENAREAIIHQFIRDARSDGFL